MNPEPLTALMRAGRKQHAGWTLGPPGVKGERPFLQPRGCDAPPLMPLEAASLVRQRSQPAPLLPMSQRS